MATHNFRLIAKNREWITGIGRSSEIKGAREMARPWNKLRRAGAYPAWWSGSLGHVPQTLIA